MVRAHQVSPSPSPCWSPSSTTPGMVDESTMLGRDSTPSTPPTKMGYFGEDDANALTPDDLYSHSVSSSPIHRQPSFTQASTPSRHHRLSPSPSSGPRLEESRKRSILIEDFEED
eukprot:7735760-Pyramimonas_sp.AAC.1